MEDYFGRQNFLLLYNRFYFMSAFVNDQIKGLANNTLEMTPKQFMQMRKQSLGGRGKPSYALKKILLVFIYYTIKPRISIMLGRQNRY